MLEKAGIETSTAVRYELVRGYCECGGEWETGDFVLDMNPPLYPHVCSHCGSTEDFHVRYPYERRVES